MDTLILASSSPRRAMLLEQIGVKYRAVWAKTGEDLNDNLSPQENAMLLAEEKAKTISREFPDFLVLGADTVVVLQNKVLGQPKSRAEAIQMLSLLSGKSHEVITGVSLIRRNDDFRKNFFVSTRVFFRKISKKEIQDYVDTKEPMDKAGAYAIQGRAAVFVDRIDGDYFNVVGLPVARLFEELKKFARLNYGE